MTEVPNVTHNPAAGQFEIRTGGGPALLRCTLRGDTMDILHTEVADEYEGKGYGSALARAALDHARASRLKVVPTCPFLRSYLDRHPEYADLRAPG